MPIQDERAGAYSFFSGDIAMESNGVRPWASAAKNREAIQEVLDGRGLCSISYPGTYEIDEAVVIRDNTEWRIGPGVIVAVSTGSELLVSDDQEPVVEAYTRIIGPVVLKKHAARSIGAITRPSGFSFDFNTYFPYGIWRDAAGYVRTGFDPARLLPDPLNFNGAVYFLDVAAGNNANSGLTWALAKQSMSSVITAANSGGVPVIVFVRTGTYIRSHSWNGGTRFAVPTIVIAVGGPVTFSLHDNATWGADGTYTNTYSTTTFTTAARIVDLVNTDESGDYVELTGVATPALCDSTENSWAQDGSKIYVNRADNAVVSNSNTRAYRPSVEGALLDFGDTIVHGIFFEGGNNGAFLADANPSASVYLLRCKGKWAGRSSAPVDGFKARDVKMMLLYEPETSRNSKDGINYQIGGSTVPVGITIGAYSHHNGISPSTSNNGLTYHTACKALDIGGCYEYNRGGNVALIDAGTQLWCVGTLSRRSLGDVEFGGTNEPMNYQCLNGAELWLDSSRGEGSKHDLLTSGGGLIRLRNHQSQGGQQTGPGISQY